jgi:nucleoid-associated protein YgaU
MLEPHAVRYLAALIAILLAAGLIEYSHLNHASPRPQTSAAIFTPSLGDPLAASKPAVTPMSTAAPPTRPGPHPPAPSATVVHHDAARQVPAGPAHQSGRLYVVRSNDTLWNLAATHLGNPLRWPELFVLNRGHPQPDGRALVDPNRIYPGWTIEFPADATGLPSANATAPTPPVPTPPIAGAQGGS